MRESFKKNESEERLHGFHSPSKTALLQFVDERGSEDYLGQLLLHAYQAFGAHFHNWFKIDIHQQLRPLTANYLALFKVISITTYT